MKHWAVKVDNSLTALVTAQKAELMEDGLLYFYTQREQGREIVAAFRPGEWLHFVQQNGVPDD